MCLWLNEGGAAGGTGQEGGSGPSQEAAGLHAEPAGAGGWKTNGTGATASTRTSPKTFDWSLKGVTSASVPTEKAPSDAAVRQHGREPQRLRRRVLYQVTGLIQSIHTIPPWSGPEVFTNDCCHVIKLMTSVWWFSVLDEKERGSHTLSTACDYISIHVFIYSFEALIESLCILTFTSCCKLSTLCKIHLCFC